MLLQGTNTNYISALTTSPFTAILTSYASGCASLAASVDSSGSLQTAFANVTYDEAAGIHGTAISSDNGNIYSADDMGNAVWSHSYNSTTGIVTEIQKLDAPTGSNPRHLAVHPNGEWVYVVFEAANEIATYKRDTLTGNLTFTNETYSLLPTGYNSSAYWADEALFSVPTSGYGGGEKSAPKYLLAATRSRTTGVDGYVSAFALNATTGAIVEQVFLVPTTNSGGSANAVAPALFDEETFAITDSGSNFIEVWKINGSSAAAVAHLDTAFGPSNVVWYS